MREREREREREKALLVGPTGVGVLGTELGTAGATTAGAVAVGVDGGETTEAGVSGEGPRREPLGSRGRETALPLSREGMRLRSPCVSGGWLGGIVLDLLRSVSSGRAATLAESTGALLRAASRIWSATI
jgi:hypothetical protein